jgi:uncharacterized protein
MADIRNRCMSTFLGAFILMITSTAYAESTSPSFDCAKASSRSEKLICSDPKLSSADAELSKLYKNELKDPGANTAYIKKAQLTWLKEERDVCNDVPCMLQTYNERIIILTPPDEHELEEAQRDALVQENPAAEDDNQAKNGTGIKDHLKALISRPDFLACDSPDLENKATDAIADSYDDAGFPEVGVAFRHPEKPRGFHDSQNEEMNATIQEAFHKELDPKNMKICDSGSGPVIIEYVRYMKLHGVVIGYGLPGHVAKF